MNLEINILVVQIKFRSELVGLGKAKKPEMSLLKY